MAYHPALPRFVKIHPTTISVWLYSIRHTLVFGLTIVISKIMVAVLQELSYRSWPQRKEQVDLKLHLY